VGFYNKLVHFLKPTRLVRCSRFWNCSNSTSQGNLFQFFIKPNLSIDIDDQYFQQLELVNRNGTSTGITQRYLRVLVRNTGRGIARKCIAELGTNTNFRKLTWNDGSIEKDIRAKSGKEFLHVVFSDSRFPSGSDNNNKKVYAIISTKESLYPEAPYIRNQDAFVELGTLLSQITITAEDGYTKTQKIKINISNQWDRLSMGKVT
jgi:hypothetical protein